MHAFIFRSTFFSVATFFVASAAPAFAIDTQGCANGVAPVQDASATWRFNAKAVYMQLPKPGAGVLVKLKNAGDGFLGQIYFGGLHQDCGNEDINRHGIPGGVATSF